MFTATGNDAMCVAIVSTCTARTVCVPPSASGPRPRALHFSYSSASSSATCGSSLGRPTVRMIAPGARCGERGRRLARGPRVEGRVAYARAAEVAVHVALRTPSVDRVVKVSARHVHVLPDVDEHDGVPGVLAIRILALGGEILVLDQQVEDLAPDRGLLAFASALHELDHLGRHD